MLLLKFTSIVSVVCAASVWLYALVSTLLYGTIEPGPLLGAMVVLPFLIGSMAAVVGIADGARVLARGRRDIAAALMALGHLSTWVLAVAIAVWALNFGDTGWKLLLLPAALMFGQIIVAAGLIVARVQRKRLAAR